MKDKKKLRAILKAKDTGIIIRAFFNDFDSENSIELKDGTVKIEIVFKDEVPLKLIDSISQTEIIELKYGNFNEQEKNEEKEETKEPETESKIAKTKKQEEPEQPKKKRGRPKKEKVEEKISFPEKEQQDERVENVNENRVKMPCMPEIKEFEKKLAMVDKTQPVEKRIKFVLDAMGFKQLSEKSQKNIMEIATTAVKSSRMSYDIIAVKAQIQGDSPMTARMEFANFVNNFAKKYDSSVQVKILDFLSDLQKIIMFGSEIEDYSDLNEN